MRISAPTVVNILSLTSVSLAAIALGIDAQQSFSLASMSTSPSGHEIPPIMLSAADLQLNNNNIEHEDDDDDYDDQTILGQLRLRRDEEAAFATPLLVALQKQSAAGEKGVDKVIEDETELVEQVDSTNQDHNVNLNINGSSNSSSQTAAELISDLSAIQAASFGYFRHSASISVILTIAYTMVFVVGIVGNSFVVAIVCKSPRMRTVTNFFIVNLAFADILVLLFCLPATLMSNLFIPYVLGWFVCKTVSYLQGVAVSASINTMVAVTMDRFLAICFPMDWHMSRRTARWTIACIWLFSLSISLPWALYFTLVPYSLDNRTIHVCEEDWPSERMGRIYFVCANLILLYLFPATVIILCYLGIWYKIERRNIPGDRPKGLKIELIMQKSKLKVVKMMMVVVVIFLLSWLPLYLIFARIKLADERSQWEEWLIAKIMPLAQWLGASNSCINPILYTFFNRKYKRGFIDLLRLGFCCKPMIQEARDSNHHHHNHHHNHHGQQQHQQRMALANGGSRAITLDTLSHHGRQIQVQSMQKTNYLSSNGASGIELDELGDSNALIPTNNSHCHPLNTTTTEADEKEEDHRNNNNNNSTTTPTSGDNLRLQANSNQQQLMLGRTASGQRSGGATNRHHLYLAANSGGNLETGSPNTNNNNTNSGSCGGGGSNLNQSMPLTETSNLMPPISQRKQLATLPPPAVDVALASSGSARSKLSVVVAPAEALDRQRGGQAAGRQRKQLSPTIGGQTTGGLVHCRHHHRQHHHHHHHRHHTHAHAHSHQQQQQQRIVVTGTDVVYGSNVHKLTTTSSGSEVGKSNRNTNNADRPSSGCCCCNSNNETRNKQQQEQQIITTTTTGSCQSSGGSCCNKEVKRRQKWRKGRGLSRNTDKPSVTSNSSTAEAADMTAINGIRDKVVDSRMVEPTTKSGGNDNTVNLATADDHTSTPVVGQRRGAHLRKTSRSSRASGHSTSGVCCSISCSSSQNVEQNDDDDDDDDNTASNNRQFIDNEVEDVDLLNGEEEDEEEDEDGDDEVEEEEDDNLLFGSTKNSPEFNRRELIGKSLAATGSCLVNVVINKLNSCATHQSTVSSAQQTRNNFITSALDIGASEPRQQVSAGDGDGDGLAMIDDCTISGGSAADDATTITKLSTSVGVKCNVYYVNGTKHYVELSSGSSMSERSRQSGTNFISNNSSSSGSSINHNRGELDLVQVVDNNTEIGINTAKFRSNHKQDIKEKQYQQQQTAVIIHSNPTSH